MKVKIFLATILLAGLISGCYYDVVKPIDPNKPPQNVSYSGDVQPIFSNSCLTTGCHNAGEHLPTLAPEDSYNSLLNGGFINTTLPEQSILYIELHSGGMPPTGALSPSQTQVVLDWIKLGAPNN